MMEPTKRSTLPLSAARVPVVPNPIKEGTSQNNQFPEAPLRKPKKSSTSALENIEAAQKDMAKLMSMTSSSNGKSKAYKKRGKPKINAASYSEISGKRISELQQKIDALGGGSRTQEYWQLRKM